jgi:hypothetical protein
MADKSDSVLSQQEVLLGIKPVNEHTFFRNRGPLNQYVEAHVLYSMGSGLGTGDDRGIFAYKLFRFVMWGCEKGNDVLRLHEFSVDGVGVSMQSWIRL